MKREDLDRIVAALGDPVGRFVREARVRTCLLVSGAGQVLAQHGFTRSYEVVNVASLAAAAHAAAGMLAGMTPAGRWTHLHHAGRDRQLFLAPLRAPGAELILIAIFDDDSSLGLVQLFFERLGQEVRGLEALRGAGGSRDAASFEHDLEAGVRVALPTDAVREA